MESVGELLRNEREAQGQTIDEISRITRISPTVLEALEGDHFSVLAAPVYVKGSLRTYARHLGLDEDEIIQMYLRFTEQNEEPEDLDDWGEIEIEVHRPRSILANRWIWTATVVAVIGVSAIVYMRVREPVQEETGAETPLAASAIDTSATREGIDGPPIHPSVTYDHEGAEPDVDEASGEGGQTREGTDANVPETVAAITPPDEAPADEPIVELSRLELMAVARERTWLRVAVDGVPFDDITLAQGERRTWQADEYFELEVGNGIGIQFFLDGEELGFAGADRTVVKGLIIDENGMSR